MLTGEGDHDLLYADDTINAFLGVGEIHGGAGDDALVGGDGTDVLVGGPGMDNETQ